jgi:phage shock protein E
MNLNKLGLILAIFLALPQTPFAASSQLTSEAMETILLDVRTPQEYSTEHIEKSINVDFYSPQFRSELQKLNKNKFYKIYCRSGNRSGQTLAIMKSLGFQKIENIGGLSSLKNQYKTCQGIQC